MTSDLDIYRTASVLIREHGEGADLVAAQHAVTFLKDGNFGGSAVWRRVGQAIIEILRQDPHEDETVH
jgi:hypothetical protein